MAVKFDGVIEAVRYSPQGSISLVRAYERRGAAFSDHLLLDRATLVLRLKKGLKFITGERVAYMGGVFRPGSPVRLVKRGEQDVLVTGNPSGDPSGEHDNLEGVPLF
jgi:hypothetical protein